MSEGLISHGMPAHKPSTRWRQIALNADIDDGRGTGGYRLSRRSLIIRS